jgi:hypothetical protein
MWDVKWWGCVQKVSLGAIVKWIEALARSKNQDIHNGIFDGKSRERISGGAVEKDARCRRFYERI